MLSNLKEDGHNEFGIDLDKISVELEAKEPINPKFENYYKIWLRGLMSKKAIVQKGFRNLFQFFCSTLWDTFSWNLSKNDP